ncbi:MAG: DMT family transporter [Planctomycetota bacterium]|jgi:drug/metabolite transporter (DMT)-like permease
MTEAAKKGNSWLPLALLLLLGAIWGGNASFSKALVTNGVSPASVVFWQTFGAGIILACVCVVRRNPVPFDARAIAYYFFIGLIGIDLAYIALVYVVQDLSAGYMSVVILFAPLTTYVFAILLRLERVQAMRALGIIVGFAGAGVLVIPRGSLPSPDLLPLALFAFIVPASYGLSNAYAERGRPTGVDNVALVTGTMFAASLGAIAAAWADNSFYPIWSDFGERDAILLLYALSMAVAFLIFYKIIALAGAVYLGQVGYIVTLSGVGWGILFFNEVTTVWLWVAIVVVAIGVGLVNYGKRNAAPA